MNIIKEFFGIGGYTREAEGYMSWQHLLFVSILMVIMVASAVILGKCKKNASFEKKLKVLSVSAFLINGFELVKIVTCCIDKRDAFYWIYLLPLYLCSIHLIVIPLAAFSKGRIREASLDFTMIFGLLAAVIGTYFAGNNYSCYPVISMDNVFSGITHCISGFCALYIAIAGLASMRKRNVVVTMGIMGLFCIMAYIANLFLDTNYMFLMRGDGTPYDLIFSLVKGNAVIYALSVVVLFVVYIAVYYIIYYKVCCKKAVKEEKAPCSSEA